jgi:hypothetical protein
VGVDEIDQGMRENQPKNIFSIVIFFLPLHVNLIHHIYIYIYSALLGGS